jgi:hypothetical protein
MPLCNCDMFYSSDVLIPFFCRAVFFDDDGNILEDVPADPVEVAMRKKFQMRATYLKILSI